MYSLPSPRELRAQIISELGPLCAQCGFADVRALQIDHVNNDGYKEKDIGPASWYYTLILRSIKKGEGRYQVLCANCNRIKAVESGSIREAAEWDRSVQSCMFDCMAFRSIP